jgi:hypothetical protein
MSEHSAPEDSLVNVLVPARHLMEVYAFLGGLNGTAVTRSDASNTGSAAQVDSQVWSIDDLRRFALTPTKTSSTIGKVLDVLAEQPDAWVSTGALESATGVPRANLKGAFAALTRHLNAHYGGRDWMLRYHWGPSVDPSYPAEAHYTLSTERAELWKEARNSD